MKYKRGHSAFDRFIVSLLVRLRVEISAISTAWKNTLVSLLVRLRVEILQAVFWLAMLLVSLLVRLRVEMYLIHSMLYYLMSASS